MTRLNRNMAWVSLAGAGSFIAAGQLPAVSFDYLDASAEISNLRPGHFVLDAGGAWVTGNATAHFRSDGSLVATLPTSSPGGDALLAQTNDGGVIRATIPVAAAPQVVQCELSRVTAQGALLWTQTVPSLDRCRWLAAGADDTIWVETISYGPSGIKLLKLSGDGSGLTQIQLPDDFQLQSDPVLNAQGGVDLAGTTMSQDASYAVSVGADGSIVWAHKGAADNATLYSIGLDAAGNAYAAGRANNGDALVAVSLAPNGTLRWSQRYPSPGLRSTDGFAVAPDGTLYTLVRSASSSAPVLQKIDASGGVRWSVQLPLQGAGGTLSQVDGHAGLRAAPNGDVLALTDNKTFGVADSRTDLVRYDADGNLLASATLAGEAGSNAIGVSAMAVLPDSSVLLSTYSNFENADGSGSIEFAATDGAFARIDRAGHGLPVAYAASVGNNGLLLDAAVAADGTTYVLSQHRLGLYNDVQHNISGAVTGQYSLSKVSPDGSRAWKVYFDGVWYQAGLSVGADRVCIGGALGPYRLGAFFGGDATLPSTRVQCHAAGSGALLWSTEIAAPNSDSYSGHQVLMRALADGSSVATYATQSGASNPDQHVFVLDAAGAIAQAHTVADVGYASGIAADGSLLCFNAGSPALIAVIGADGALRYTRPAAIGTNVITARYLDDRSIQYIGTSSGGSLTVSSLAADGTPRWTATLLGTSSAHGGFDIAAADDADSTYFAVVTALATRLSRLDRASGAIRWQSDADDPGGPFGIAADPVSGNAILYAQQPHKLALKVFERASGAARAPFYRTCGGIDCSATQLDAASVGSDGTLRVVLGMRASNTVPLAPPQVLGIDAVAQTPSAIPPAQPGIDGAWFAPYAPGQGFVIDYIAGGNTVFIPWFTFTPAGGADPAALAWYTLQGTPEPGASEVELKIGRNDGGVFRSGTVAAHQVGVAHVSFENCDHATLSYEFEADTNSGAAGVIDIQRLTPSTSACLGAAGTLPAENGSPPSNGFDARQSGSWFDPQTAGQGLQFAVIPAAAGSSGLLYAAWFTYDPAGAADDPSSQHWFTLQGDLSNAKNGQATVTIAATLGGSFDDAPTGNTIRVGQSTVTFVDCQNATVSYQFDDVAAAHAYRKLAGSMHLVKIGGCGS